ncbi:MAG: glycosyltransferase family 61 protein [Rhodospirillaceae bacterium]|nr:glycosyltransferase family 61 protein [Rhodospirillaceae bacterium]
MDVFIDEDCFLLGGSDNYYHWLIDYLPRLNSYQHHDRFDEARFLTNDRLQRFQRESLQLLGIGKDRLLQVPKALSQPQTIHCAKLYAAPIALEKMHLKPDALSWLRENLGAACAPLSDTPAGGRHIYISRKDAGTRKVINEKDVATFLASLGFEIIVPGKLSLKKQIAAFADAAVIVGAHGAGLANMVFAPPGARVIEFMGSAAFQQGFMRQLAESCGHRFDRMYCQSQASKTQRQHNAEENFNMFVSLKNLAALLSS